MDPIFTQTFVLAPLAQAARLLPDVAAARPHPTTLAVTVDPHPRRVPWAGSVHAVRHAIRWSAGRREGEGHLDLVDVGPACSEVILRLDCGKAGRRTARLLRSHADEFLAAVRRQLEGTCVNDVATVAAVLEPPLLPAPAPAPA
jgi:hypothetical protein